MQCYFIALHLRVQCIMLVRAKAQMATRSQAYTTQGVSQTFRSDS